MSLSERNDPPAPEGTIDDPASWVDAYGDYLLRYAYMRVNDATVAEDLVQDTFLAAMKARERFGGRSTLKTWLTGILRNKIFDHYRKRGRSENFSDLSTFYEREIEETFDQDRHWKLDTPNLPREWRQDQQEQLDRKEFWEQFHKCTRRLPERIRRIYIMREIDDATTEEICAAFDISRDNFWTILHRARTGLRKCLEDNWFSPGDVA